MLFLLLLPSCAEAPKRGAPPMNLEGVSFSSLSGWQGDSQSQALAAFIRSCPFLVKRNPEWENACAAAGDVPAGDESAARAFFEQNFTPFEVSTNDGSQGLFTGYYEPELPGSLTPGGAFMTPLYARPPDLVDVDLGDFSEELHGKRITGRIFSEHGYEKLKPYDTRAEIARGSLADRASVIAYVSDPVDAFFLAVQGSGRIRLEGGDILRVGYDGGNGHSYVAIGKVMAEMGLIEKPVTMEAIRAWLEANPGRGQEIMEMNPSYVFFRKIEVGAEDGPPGAAGVPLTPRRSLAVDPAYLTLGMPVWLETTDGEDGEFHHLMVAQDTGGAIKGPIRGDVFWGAGPGAAQEAGAMQSRGRYYLLLPKELHVGQ